MIQGQDEETNGDHETRLVIDSNGHDVEKVQRRNGAFGRNLAEIASPESDPDEVIGVVLQMADVPDDDIRRLSSHSSTCSVSPQSLPVGDGITCESGRGSRNQTPDGSSAVDEDLVNSPVLTVACGYLTAKLHMDRFYCPGIHQLCVEYNNQFLTPKQFTIVAAKDKQKDWKGAIKINRQPVRILFERNLLDFYKHSEYCSGRCVSKSYKPLGDSSLATSASGVEFIQQTVGNGGPYSIGDAAIGRTGAAADIAAFASGFVVKNELDDDDEEEQLHQPPQFNRKVSGICADVSSLFRNGTGIDLNGSSSLMQAEPILYWNCVSQLGLFHELTQEIEQQLQVLKTSFGIPELRPKAAKKLSDLVRVLDIGDKIQQKLIAKRTYANAQCALLATELNELKKIAESQEKKQREVKRKSELLDHLIGNLQDQKRKRRGSSATAPSGASSMTAIAVPTSPNDASPNDE